MKLFMILLVTFTLSSCTKRCYVIPEEGAWVAKDTIITLGYFETKVEAERSCSIYLTEDK